MWPFYCILVISVVVANVSAFSLRDLLQDIPDVFKGFECGKSDKYLLKHAKTLRLNEGNSAHHRHLHHHVIRHGDHVHLFQHVHGHARRRRYVVGGQESEIGEFPWMALIGRKKNGTKDLTWICDGVLIHPEWVLTAAHCVLDLWTFVVRLGEHNISARGETTHQDFIASSIVIHPQFKLEVNYHDLALIHLPSPVQITEFVMPICFPWKAQPNLVGKKSTLAGWGAESFGGSLSNVLRDVDVEIFDPAVCNSSYGALRDFDTLWPQGITGKYLICAGGPNGGVDSCQGDSGGPLILNKNGRIELIGVVSKGFGCGLKEFPGIYVSVREYLRWICEVVIENTMV